MKTQEVVKNLIEQMAFEEAEVKCDEETQKISIFINDPIMSYLKENLGSYVRDFHLVINLIAKKLDQPQFFVDVNNYRAERGRIIVELAKAAAKKVIATKESIPLPPMNSYERRLVHTTLAIHPEIKTESVGEGKERHIIITLV